MPDIGPNWRPPTAYIPGSNDRHDEAIFDWIKVDAQVAWQYGLAFFADRFYWEAHEVLEAVWLTCPQNSAEKVQVQSLIQFANAGLKFRMGRPKAGRKLFDIATALHRDFLSRRADAEWDAKVVAIRAQIRSEEDAI